MKHGAVIRLETEPIPLAEGDSLVKGTLKASKLLGLGVSEEDGSLVIIEGSNLDKFLRARNISLQGDYSVGDDIPELCGLPCVVQKTETGYLEIA
jgi:hypothetical protein